MRSANTDHKVHAKPDRTYVELRLAMMGDELRLEEAGKLAERIH